MNLFITLAELKAMGPCVERYHHLMRNIEYDEKVSDSKVRIPMELIYEINGSIDFTWAVSNMNLAPGLEELKSQVCASPEWQRFMVTFPKTEEERFIVKELCQKFQRNMLTTVRASARRTLVKR